MRGGKVFLLKRFVRRLLLRLLLQVRFRSRIAGVLDHPSLADSLRLPGTVLISGWAISAASETLRIEVFLDSTLLTEIPYETSRLDVPEIIFRCVPVA